METRKLVKGRRRSRATLVARQESLTAAEDGQEAAIVAAQDQGAIENVTQRWVSVRDRNRDPICARLHGQKVPLGKPFTDPGTSVKYRSPPEPHSACRCGRQYSFRKTAKAKAASELVPSRELISLAERFFMDKA